MKKHLLKTVMTVLTMALVLSLMVSCDAIGDTLSSLFGREEQKEPEIAKYTVTFDLGGGTAPEGFASAVEVEENSKVELKTPTREGHTFLGWFAGEAEFAAETPITADTTLVAKWQVNKVNVTFLDYYDQIIATQVIDWGTAATAPSIDQEAAGMLFKGWDIDITSIKGDVTIRPIYAYKVYTVTFDVGANATAIAPQVINFGDKPVRPEDPDKMGHSLVGWYLEPELTTECVFDTAFDADTTLYAKYTNDYHVIRTAADLIAISENPTWKYVLLNDIDLGGNPWTPIESFSGAIDGNGKKIYNFTMTTTNAHLGFINQNSGLIKNLTFDDFRVSFDHTAHRHSYSGVIAAVNTGTIRNCAVLKNDVSITMNVSLDSGGYRSTHLGVLVGYNTGTVKNCVNNADITVNTYSYAGYDTGTTQLLVYAASAVGLNTEKGIIEKTEVYGKVTIIAKADGAARYAANQNYYYIGGLVGMNNTDSVVFESSSNVQISCELIGSLNIKNIDLGLIAGKNVNTITDCYANGAMNVTVSSAALSGTIGGAVGINATMCKIENVYADVDITIGDSVIAYVGGLLGKNEDGAKVNKNIYTGNITLGTGVTKYGFVFAERAGEQAHCYYDSVSTLKGGENITSENACQDGVAVATADLLKESFVFNTLQWDKDVWSIVDGSAPTLNALK